MTGFFFSKKLAQSNVDENATNMKITGKSRSWRWLWKITVFLCWLKKKELQKPSRLLWKICSQLSYLLLCYFMKCLDSSQSKVPVYKILGIGICAWIFYHGWILSGLYRISVGSDDKTVSNNPTYANFGRCNLPSATKASLAPKA